VLAFVLAVVAAATPAPAASPLATAAELYQGAIARLAALPQSPYLSYEMDQTGYTREQGIIFDFGQNVVERRADRGFHNVVTYGATMLIGRHYLTPDAFIPNVNEPMTSQQVEPNLDTPAPTAPILKTIATVSSTASYVVTYVGDETIANNFCGDAAHIALVPKRNPDAFNVRDLWIRRSDFALCAAIFDSWTFSGDGHFRVKVAAWLDERGFITNWRNESIDQPGLFDMGVFKNVIWVTNVPPGLYFSH
jgi:hypothetical protein